MKELLCCPKVGLVEPACINSPATKERITDIEKIKMVSLEHSIKILTKTGPGSVIKMKKDLYKRIMKKNNNNSYKLDMAMYKEVLADINKNGKKMFELLKKSGYKYKDYMYWHMIWIFKD